MQQVEIRLKEHLDEKWKEWLDGFSIIHVEEGETVVTGACLDQAALFGLMTELRDLGATLLSVNLAETRSNDER